LARTDRYSSEPDHCGGEVDKALEVNGSAVVTSGEATEVFHSIEAPLDAIAIDVDDFIVRNDDLARAV